MFATHEAAGSAWILKYRQPPTEQLALVLQKVNEIAGDLPPSVSLWEKAYRLLLRQGAVDLVEAPMQVAPVRSRLTADEYNKMSIASIRQSYSRDPEFRKDVDDLIKQGKAG